MTEVRSKLIEEINKLYTNCLSFHVIGDYKVFSNNFKLLFELTRNLDTIRQHLNQKVDDNPRWMTILSNIYEEVDHYRLLLDTSFDEHLLRYHSETQCYCWRDARSNLLREFSMIRQRLFGPI